MVPDTIRPFPYESEGGWRIRAKLCGVEARQLAKRRAGALRQPGVPSMIDSLEVKVLYPT
jgi:hypothetical protein